MAEQLDGLRAGPDVRRAWQRATRRTSGAALHPNEWQIIVAAAPERQSLDPDGKPVTIRDRAR